MKVMLVNGPEDEPVSVDDLKLYLRSDGDDEDDLLAALIRSARSVVEASVGMALIDQRWRIVVEAWDPCRLLQPPIRPLRRIEAVSLCDADGVAEELDAADFAIEVAGDAIRTPREPPAIPEGGWVEIEVTAGFGEDPDDVPEPMRLAMQVMAANWFDHRGEAPARAGAPLLPDAARALLAPFRPLRLA